MYWLNRLLSLVPLLVLGGFLAWLEQRYSFGLAATIYSGVALVGTLAGGWLLHTSRVGEVSWRNRLAANLIPFSWLAGHGTLQELCLFNMLGSSLFGLIAFFVFRYLRVNDYAFQNVGGWMIACGLAWSGLIGTLLFLVRQYRKRYYTGASGLRTFLKLIAGPLIALVASLGLVGVGLSPLAFFVAMIPLAVLFLPMSSLLLIIILAKLSGKPIRWN